MHCWRWLREYSSTHCRDRRVPERMVAVQGLLARGNPALRRGMLPSLLPISAPLIGTQPPALIFTPPRASMSLEKPAMSMST